MITSGLTLNVRMQCDEYPAPEWSLSALLRGPDQIDIVASVDHVFSVKAATTSGWTAGLYNVSVRATLADDVLEIEAGQLTITADLASAPAGKDQRGHARKVLDNIQAVLEGRASKDQSSYTINGRTLVRTPMADLLLLRDRYKAEVAKDAAGGKPRRLIGRTLRVRHRHG